MPTKKLLIVLYMLYNPEFPLHAKAAAPVPVMTSENEITASPHHHHPKKKKKKEKVEKKNHHPRVHRTVMILH